MTPADAAYEAAVRAVGSDVTLVHDGRGHSATNWWVHRGSTPVARVKHHIDRPDRTAAEVAALRFARTNDVAVPAVLAVSTDGEAFAMSVVRGDPWSLIQRDAGRDAAIARSLRSVLDQLHSLTPDESSGVKRTTDPLRLTERLLQNAARYAKRVINGADVVDWLRRHAPVVEDLPDGLVHGDLRLDNVLVDADRSEVVAVVDLERASAAPAAWDAVKLHWWCLDEISGAPEPLRPEAGSAVAWFAAYEALGLAANFDGHYRSEATRQLDSLLSRGKLARWRGGSNNS